MKTTILLFLISFMGCIFPHTLRSQASFEAPIEVCANESFEITNTSTNTTSVFWNFCGIDFTNPMEGKTLENINALYDPVFMDIAQDGDDYFLFVTNNSGRLVKLFFGNSLLNIPVETNMGNLNSSLIAPSESIQLIFDGQKWWGFIIGGSSLVSVEDFLRLDFGNSLHNNPLTTNLGNIGELSYPHDLYIFKENENWFGWTINKFSNSLTRFDFGNSLGNTPTGINVGNIGNLSHPSGFFPFFQNGNWHIFIANESNNSISRLDFGSQLSNIPTGVNLGDLGILKLPRDIMITDVCGSILGFVLNKETNSVIVLDFGSDLTNTPTTYDLGNIANLDFPHSISESFRVGNDLYFFVTNVSNNSISQIKISGCNNAFPNTSTDFNPPSIQYDEPGNYIIQLITDIGLPSQDSYCHVINVTASPNLDLGKDTTICNGQNLTLVSEDETTIWQNEIDGLTYEVNEEGLYFAETTYDDCVVYDSIFVEFENCEACFSFPNTFTPNSDGVNDFFKTVQLCNNNLQMFNLTIFNRWGNQVFETKEVTEGWDGFLKNKNAPTDVYVWVLKYSFFDGEKIISKTQSGDVTLIR